LEVQSSNLNILLQEVDKTIQHHKTLAKERGEDFSLFSIMGMESNETHTHSAIIAALLNPKHNHYKETLFLEKFLETIGYDIKEDNLEKAQIIKEFHIGKIDKDYETGGFIDILIKFDSGRTIAIENKIYAKDQWKQLYRYSKYNQGKTTLYYLNLFGTEPTKESSHTLKSRNINKISYKKDILDWLDKCQSELLKGSMLDVSIKKYSLLLKKLTNTMDRTQEIEMTKSILDHFEAARYIHSNLDKLINNIRETFRQAVILDLKNKLDINEYRIEAGQTPDNLHSQIWIELVKTKNSTLRFGVESFSGRGNKEGIMLAGVFDKLTQGINIDFVDDSIDTSFSKWWPVFRPLKTLENNTLHLNSGPLLNKLSDKDSQQFNELLDHTISQIIKFIHEYTATMEEIEQKRVNSENFIENDLSVEELD
jgi:hypothetical protein